MANPTATPKTRAKCQPTPIISQIKAKPAAMANRAKGAIQPWRRGSIKNGSTIQFRVIRKYPKPRKNAADIAPRKSGCPRCSAKMKPHKANNDTGHSDSGAWPSATAAPSPKFNPRNPQGPRTLFRRLDQFGQTQTQPFHAARIGIHDFKFGPQGMADHFSAHGNTTGKDKNQSAKGIDFLGVDIFALGQVQTRFAGKFFDGCFGQQYISARFFQMPRLRFV